MAGAPEVNYARSGDVSIAYQVFGEGDLDLVFVTGFFSHLELIWEHEPLVQVFRRLGASARVVIFDRRGSGLSDPVAGAPTLEERMDDVRAVMDAAGMERAAVIGMSEGAAMSILLAAAHPDRVSKLVLYGGMARSTAAERYEFATPREVYDEARFELLAPFWGQGATLDIAAPSDADNEEYRAFFARMERASASPSMFGQLVEMYLEIDVREAARAVRVPTLIVHRRQDLLVNVRHGRWLAENMPTADYVEVEGMDHNFWADPDPVMEPIEEFLTGSVTQPEPDRVLATVLFTDIVDSTRRAVELGDAKWRELLRRHEADARDAVKRGGGNFVKWTGDGLMATFDGPGRAIESARAILERSERHGLRIRAGLHTGEIERMGDDVGGIGVHIAARVGALAQDSEILVSRTVKDLVVGSSLRFEDRGAHALKGLPDEWALYAVSA